VWGTLPSRGRRAHAGGVGEDMLSSGPDEPTGIPRAAAVVAVLAVLVVGVQGARQLSHQVARDRADAADQAPRPQPSPTAIDPLRRAVPTQLRVLAGGEQLALVRVANGEVSTLENSRWRQRGPVMAMLSRPAGQVALTRTEDAGPAVQAGQAWLLPPSGPAVALGPATAIAPVGEAALAIITGRPSAMTVRTFQLDPIAATGKPVRLPPEATVIAGSSAVLMVEMPDRGVPALQLRSARTGAVIRTVARPGHALTSDGNRVAWLRPGCDDRCVIRVTDLRTSLRLKWDDVLAVLDGERVGAAAFGPDGMFALAGEVRLQVMAPREPALLVSGAFPAMIQTVPLATLPNALTWSRSGRWVVVTDPGQDGLLAWRRLDGTLYRVAVPPGTLRGTAFLEALPP
jgi:hypothetical protein